MIRVFKPIIIPLFYLFLAPLSSFAHEAYVLTKEQFNRGLLSQPDKNPLSIITDKEHIGISILSFIVVFAIYIAIFLFSKTAYIKSLDKTITKAKNIARLSIRLSLGYAFFAASLKNAMFGPELSLDLVPYGELIRILLLVISVLIMVGLVTEIASFIAYILFLYFSFHFGIYMINYVHYLAVIVMLIFLGSRDWSLDKLYLGKELLFQSFEKIKDFKVTIIRVLFGIAIAYTGYAVKIIHPDIPIDVYNNYHLSQYFFNIDPQFFVAVAGLTEIAIGILIILGLRLRLTLAVFLILITLSFFYFKESLWPHILLFGISFYLFTSPTDRFTKKVSS